MTRAEAKRQMLEDERREKAYLALEFITRSWGLTPADAFAFAEDFHASRDLYIKSGLKAVKDKEAKEVKKIMAASKKKAKKKAKY